MKKSLKKLATKKIKNIKSVKGGILRRTHMQNSIAASYEDIIID